MNDRDFSKTLTRWTNKKTKRLNTDLILKDTAETRHAALMHIVRKRGPVLVELVTPLCDRSWLNCMGYMHTTKGANYTFVHTSEHTIR